MADAYRKTVCVDFDGTLNTYSGWRGPDYLYPPRTGAKEFLVELKARGFRVIIFTTRAHDGVWSWLRQYGMEQNVDEVTDVKPPAFVYVDDRGMTFRGNYQQTLKDIETFEPYWKKSGHHEVRDD
ncbi:MAG TPA: HAD family hydrolase [Chloroflexota bacterium]|nr:HAD family hydrolase [Chloroflexota bacterium]